MLIDSKELHKRINLEAQKLYGLTLDGLIIAQAMVNDLEFEAVKAEDEMLKDMYNRKGLSNG